MQYPYQGGSSEGERWPVFIWLLDLQHPKGYFVPYLVLVLSFLFANALGIDILEIVQQFIRIYSVLIFIYMTGLCARRLYFQVKNDTGFINKLCDNLFVIDLIVGAKVIRFAGRAAEV